MMTRGAMIGWAAMLLGITIVWGIQVFAIPWTDPYYADIVVRVGMNLLAVMGLALVLVFPGQFSLGHAGFMAVGAYTAGALSLYAHVPPPVCLIVGGGHPEN